MEREPSTPSSCSPPTTAMPSPSPCLLPRLPGSRSGLVGHRIPALLEEFLLIGRQGVWNVPEEKFNAEKAALETVLKQHPDTTKWLAGINVGSESLYRKEVKPWRLAEQIYGWSYDPVRYLRECSADDDRL